MQKVLRWGLFFVLIVGYHCAQGAQQQADLFDPNECPVCFKHIMAARPNVIIDACNDSGVIHKLCLECSDQLPVQECPQCREDFLSTPGQRVRSLVVHQGVQLESLESAREKDIEGLLPELTRAKLESLEIARDRDQIKLQALRLAKIKAEEKLTQQEAVITEQYGHINLLMQKLAKEKETSRRLRDARNKHDQKMRSHMAALAQNLENIRSICQVP